MDRKTYLKKFKDPKWQKKRLEIFERDGWECQFCGGEGQTLNVHHRYYEYGNDPWDYPDEALVTLCETCHENETGEMKNSIGLLNKAIRTHFFSDLVFDLAAAFHKPDLVHNYEELVWSLQFLLANKTIQKDLIDKWRGR